jgi:hypothetical protein
MLLELHLRIVGGVKSVDWQIMMKLLFFARGADSCRRKGHDVLD